MLMKFQVGSGEIDVEVDPHPTTEARVEKAGLAEAMQGAATAVQVGLGQALAAVAQAAHAFYASSASIEHPPQEVEVSFGLKASGEVNGFVIAKTGGEANFSVKMVWKASPKV